MRTILVQSLLAIVALSVMGDEKAIEKPMPFDTPAADAMVAKLQVFLADNAWYADISSWPLAQNSQKLVASVGTNLKLRSNYDMGYILAPAHQKLVEVKITSYPQESDPGPFPVPDELPIEGWPSQYQSQRQGRLLTLLDVQRDVLNEGGDRHAIIIDVDKGKLHEFYNMKRTSAGWEAAQASTFDLRSNSTRPADWTSADAAGLPIFPGVVRYDELQRGEIKHAIRFTAPITRKAYVAPASHHAGKSNDPNLPRMGERFRLRAEFSLAGYSKDAQTVLRALQKHGMILADNGIAWGMSFTPDPRMKPLHDELRRITGKELEAVNNP